MFTKLTQSVCIWLLRRYYAAQKNMIHNATRWRRYDFLPYTNSPFSNRLNIVGSSRSLMAKVLDSSLEVSYEAHVVHGFMRVSQRLMC